MPASVQAPCKHPLISETDARAIIARYIAAFKACDQSRANGVLFYDDLREGLAGQ